jgi:hypothetical protein
MDVHTKSWMHGRKNRQTKRKTDKLTVRQRGIRMDQWIEGKPG